MSEDDNGSDYPVIGITADISKDDDKIDPEFFLNSSYVNSVTSSGGLPFIIPFPLELKMISKIISLVDGLLISGGDFDIDPATYGSTLSTDLSGRIIPERTLTEILLFKEAIRSKIPVLGICGGHQLINVALNGTLHQDITFSLKSAIRHTQSPTPAHKPTHTVYLEDDSLLHSITDKDRLKVNSTHHQGIDKLGDNIKISGRSSDDLVEAIEQISESVWILGLQWHPEKLFKSDPVSRSIFKEFIKASSKAKRS